MLRAALTTRPTRRGRVTPHWQICVLLSLLWRLVTVGFVGVRGYCVTVADFVRVQMVVIVVMVVVVIMKVVTVVSKLAEAAVAVVVVSFSRDTV